jgi:hypothetical protein
MKHPTKLEEEVIVQHVLDKSLCSVLPSKANVQDMADRLLSKYRGKPTGKNWVDRFIKCTPMLQTQWNCPYNCQQAACKNLAVIQPWFMLVQSMKAKYDIANENT